MSGDILTVVWKERKDLFRIVVFRAVIDVAVNAVAMARFQRSRLVVD